MAAQGDNWSSEAYQHSASFVPKLATKIVQWLDPQDGDAILDIGCGDGILTMEIARSRDLDSIVGIDSSPSMIESAKRAADANSKATFLVLDANDLEGTLKNTEVLIPNTFDKAFSNAAMHWILRPADSRASFFRGVRDMLKPGGTFAFEMGGLGNVSELRCALLMAVARRVGLAKAQEADPWFFPDEEWTREIIEKQVGGWKILKIEREWRPTTADAGGVEGWIRLMGKQFFGVLPEEEREECIREVVDVLEVVCRKPGGGFMFSYVRLRVLAKKIGDGEFLVDLRQI